MTAPVVVVLGSGTGVGKTHVSERLLRAANARGVRAYGYKPVESGIDPSTPEGTSDIDRLRRASCHVKQPPPSLSLRTPISPHLAARDEGVTIPLDTLLEVARNLATSVDLLLVEFAGGAFSPFTDSELVIDATRRLAPTRALLVLPDRLGVLHDAGATTRACALAGVPLDGLVLNAAATLDASTGRNAAELPRVTGVPLLTTLPREAPDAPLPADHPAHDLVAWITRG